MNELKRTMDNIQELIDFAEEKGWSEEELAKVIDILHSELGNRAFSHNLFGDNTGNKPSGNIVNSGYTRS